MMITKFTRSFLTATLVIYGTTATIAKAAMTNRGETLLVADQPVVTTFSCIPDGNDFATIARRGDRATPPIIIWKPALGYYTPKAHCYIVSQELTRIVAENGGTLKSLQLITGTVNDQIVACAVKELGSFCNSSNILFTLRPEKTNSAMRL
ncbi:MAG: hypothetical protein JO235_10810 [Chroococcidiopsidaceae cyanobacterium CP_BM_RX_35]|nr:hypothetical protein [Chroococcidiopsidaceae cyanobacterium CP_BM_RX_35]